MFRRRIACMLLLALMMVPLSAGKAAAQPPALTLEVASAILIEPVSGQVLYEQNPDKAIAPASLTKLMTLHLAFKQLASGKMKLEDKVIISRNAWAQNPSLKGSSLMFLEPGMNVTVGEILKGVAIPSGNDASVAIAEHIAGTEQAFISLMNEEAKALGFKVMTFYDPHGLSPRSQVTAREMADFARIYITQHPQSLKEYHSQVEYQFPQWENLPADKRQATPKEQFKPMRPQFNRNWLLTSFPGTDGLKTGFIDESGYHLVVTTERNGMRLIGVVMGAKSEAHREQQALALMNWGFRNWALVSPVKADENMGTVRVWKGQQDEVTVVPRGPVTFVVPAGEQQKLEKKVTVEPQTTAPVAKGAKLGTLTFTSGGKTVYETDLVAAQEVPAGGFFKRMWDSIRLWFTGLWNKK